MKSQPIISVSGLRGIVGDSLDPTLAARFVAAFAPSCPEGPILVARDGRSSGVMLMHAVTSGLLAAGRDVVQVGVAATPTLGVLVRDQQAAGAVQISASHNPPEYNGLKLFDKSGRVIPAAAGEAVVQRFRGEEEFWVEYQRIGQVTTLPDPHAAHLQKVLATVDSETIRRRKFRVLLDANHGAGGALGQRLLRELGCEVVLLGGEPHGRFAHPPEPTAENLADVAHEIVEAGVDIGFCQDPDADRLALIDHHGRYVGEEFTVAVTVEHALRQAQAAGKLGPVVTNCATSRMTEDICQRFGAAFTRSAVGEANVTDEMMRVQAIYGGEGNGGPIDPRVGYVRDSFVGMAQVLEAMASTGHSLAELVDALPQYAIVKSKASVEGLDLPVVLNNLKAHFASAEICELDGLRLDWPGRWLLVRASNTEPIVRLIAEAESQQAAEQLVADAARVVSG